MGDGAGKPVVVVIVFVVIGVMFVTAAWHPRHGGAASW